MSLTLPAPGHQGLRLAFCHTLHHRGTAEHDCGVARRRHNHDPVQVFCQVCKKTRTEQQVSDHWQPASRRSLTRCWSLSSCSLCLSLGGNYFQLIGLNLAHCNQWVWKCLFPHKVGTSWPITASLLCDVRGLLQAQNIKYFINGLRYIKYQLCMNVFRGSTDRSVWGR